MRKVNKNIVFYGGGRMTESIIRGLLCNEAISPDRITVHEIIPDRCTYLAETYGVSALTDAAEEMKRADMILIGVNPHQVSGAAEALRPLLHRDTVVLSFACGVEIRLLEDKLGSDKKIVRIVPNTLSRTGFGYSSVHVNENLSEEDKRFVDDLLHGLGKVLYLEEEQFNSFQAYGCTGPFWVYKFAEAMINAGIYVGFTREEAREQIVENLLGAAKELQLSGASPTAKIEELTSPGGITIEAMRVLQESGDYSAPTIASMVEALKKCAAVANR